MADLTNSLPTEENSQQRFIQPAPATPSVLTSIFDFAGNVASVADKAWTTLDRDQAGKRAAADEQAKNNAVKTVAAGVLPYVQGNPNIPPGSQQAYTNSQPLATQAANAQQAATQGKVDPSMAQAKSMAAFRQALASNPGHEFAVFQAFKEMGVDNMMMQQYKNAEASVESDDNAQQDAIHTLEKDAVNKYGYTNYYQMTPQDRATTLATVGQLNAQEIDLDNKTKLADLSTKNLQLTQSQQTVVQKQQSQGLLASAMTYMTSSYGNLNKIMVNLLADPTLANQPGRLEQLQSHLMSVSLPALDAQYNLKIAQVAPYLTTEDRSALDSAYQSQRKSLVDMISGPQSVVEMNGRILKNISDTAGIDYAKSAPTLMKLQKMIGPQAIGVLLSPSVQGNKPLMTMLTNELNNVITDPTKMPSFTEFVQSLNGTVDPASWDPQKSLAMAPALLSATGKLSLDTPTRNGTDKQSHQALMNSIKQTAGIAVDVVPQWGFGNVLAQSKILNANGVTYSMFNTTANTPERLDAIRAWIPANTRSYQTLAGMDSGDQFYTAKLDPHTLQWQAVWNGTYAGSKAGNDGIVQLTGGRPDMIKPSPSGKILDQVSTLNHMLNNLSQSASHGFDDSLGDKAIPYPEAKRYFATGEMPATLQKSSTTKNGKTPEQNVDDAISHALDFVNKLPTGLPKPVKGGEIGPSPLAPAIGASAEKYGVPTNIAAALFHTETSGGRNTKDSDKGAVGPGQIMPATAAGYGVTDLHGLKPEENVDLALHILSDNYKRTGNWADALSMYHSGHDLATATARNLNDGHMKTSDYVATTMATASSISPENLQRYGYVRY